MIRSMMRAFAAFASGTVLTQLILLGYFVASGNFNHETGVKIISLLNGIDISGNRLQQILRASEDREQPDFEEILEARQREGMNMDLRLRSQSKAKAHLSEQLAALTNESQIFDERREDLFKELDRLKNGALSQGLQEVQRTIQALEPEQAKQQLKLMYDDERIDDVVSIVKAMPMDKRSDILAEFDDDEKILYEILGRFREGLPMAELIDGAKNP